MNNKLEIAFDKHIKRLEKGIAEAQTRINKQNLSNDGMEAMCVRDYAKMIALLREGVIPKYSDLPVGPISKMNNLPPIEMFEFADLMDETTAIMHDLDLIDWGKNYKNDKE
jgi:hypothetical protein